MPLLPDCVCVARVHRTYLHSLRCCVCAPCACASAVPRFQNQTLHSLLAARGVAREYIYVAQHGDDKAVATVAHNLGLRSYQNMDFGMEGESKVEVCA